MENEEFLGANLYDLEQITFSLGLYEFNFKI